MILSFKKQFPWGSPTNFEQKILSGSKIHTIREDPHHRWSPKRLIHFATGVRTKFYNCFRITPCVSIQQIQIKHFDWKYAEGTPGIIVTIGGMVLNQEAIKSIAKNDGFDSVEDFFKWFNTDFQGVIIHWTDFRY